MRIFVFVMSLLFVAMHSLGCWSQTVGPIRGTVPVDSIVFPESPTTEDLIVFNLFADGMTHANPCEQLRSFGGAQFETIVDESSRSIQIGVTGTHSGVCDRSLDPVNGIEGSVGPLAAGDWQIKTSFLGTAVDEPFAFTVTPASIPEPTGAVLLAAAVLMGSQRRRRSS